MTDLLERLEKATGPDRELDEAIHALQPEPKVIVPLAYTRSIDAALTLVPEGWAFNRLNQYISIENPAWGWGAHLRPLHNPSIGYAVGESRATPALALVIACLKARLPLQQKERA